MLVTILAKTESSGTVFSFILKRFNTLQESGPSPCSTFAETKRLQMPSKDPLALVWLFSNLAKLSGFSLTGQWDMDYTRVQSSNKSPLIYVSIQCPVKL